MKVAALQMVSGMDLQAALEVPGHGPVQDFLAQAASFDLPSRNGHTWGHSLLVDPWGLNLAAHAEGAGVVLGELSAARLTEVRRPLPALSHRVL